MQLWSSLVGIVVLLAMRAVEGDVSAIVPSSQVAYYHYPTPKGAQLNPQPIHRQHFHSQPQRYQAPQHSQYTAQHQSIARQFSAPALEHAAFTTALTNQGYTAVDSSSSSARSNTLTPQSSPVLASSSSNSFNIKLPVPLGITPINIAPLPLQAGSPYNDVQSGLTSYGTPYPQRR